jgi:hypothetical protein
MPPDNSKHRNRPSPNFKLRTKPFGASVCINGKFVGMARLDGIDVPWDQGEIVVNKDGYCTERFKFSEPPSEPDVFVELVPIDQAVRQKKRARKIGLLAACLVLITLIGASFVFFRFVVTAPPDLKRTPTTQAALTPPETKDRPNATNQPVDEITWLKQAAESGDVNAQAVLGYRYHTGTGVNRDDREAVLWYKKAAEQGHANAQNSLGWMIQQGRGVKQNDLEAAKWYLKAAEQGNPIAQSNIGNMYLAGRGVQLSDKEALKWFKKSSAQGAVSGKFSLGGMLLEGKGVAKNEREGVKLIQESAEQGYAAAQLNLGKLYESGTVIPKDYSEAVKWYRLSAEQGNSVAQSRLGMMYMQGRGVLLDRAEGQKWLEKSRVKAE